MENSDESNVKERLKMRIAVLEESVKSCEVECKASRETVLRLVAELDQERRKAASSTAALDSLKVELDGLALGRKSVEMEKQTLTERVEASRRVIEAARRESHCLEKQVEELGRKRQVAEGGLQVFLEKVSGILQEKSDTVVLPTEKDILQKLDHLCNKTVSELEVKLSYVSEELSRQTELQHGTQQRSQLAEQQVQNLRERLQGLEAELLTADMQRDEWQHSKQHYEDFLDQLSETMRVDSIAAELGFDMRLKLILSRAEQLVKQEGTSLLESKSLTYTLQRKVKSQKDQLESKGLHIQFLRKKVSELEEEKRSRSLLALEREDVQARRLQKKVERLQGELRAAKQSNTELKAQLSHTDDLKLKIMEQSQTMQEQKKKLDQLLDGKTKVEKKLSAVSLDLQSQDKRTKEDQVQLDTLRQSLAQLTERQRELVDFRMVVSQMLGLDATALALPNHDIINLLESLLHTHYHHHHHHRLHHHVSNMPWHCATHHSQPHVLHVHQQPDSSALDVSHSRSACPGDALLLHET
ncbi:coiled-coil domain-containing protein 170 [Parambassis ranga]|uniref:Coiled-coil domain-containing protein 170 n=1 Tax=Parambassis ranga TaxID=210632 RepID=A0A6P7H9H5_9TELE|nr:coiled-coil domain-containing protein 170 [Parambassis ranga]